MSSKHALQSTPTEVEPKLYALRISGVNGEMDPELAATLEKVCEASRKNPDNFFNNRARHEEALEGLAQLLAEWQEENGAFTEEELEAARISLYGE